MVIVRSWGSNSIYIMLLEIRKNLKNTELPLVSSPRAVRITIFIVHDYLFIKPEWVIQPIYYLAIEHLWAAGGENFYLYERKIIFSYDFLYDFSL